GIAERLRPGAKREPVLMAWGYTVEGRRVLHLMAGSSEDAETVMAFFEGMKMRGLPDPHHQGDRGVLSARCPPALNGASYAQSGSQGAGGGVAGVQGTVQAAYQAPSRAIARELAADATRPARGSRHVRRYTESAEQRHHD